MLTVAPIGNTKLDVSLDTPAFSLIDLIVTGSVALDEEVEKAKEGDLSKKGTTMKRKRKRKDNAENENKGGGKKKKRKPNHMRRNIKDLMSEDKLQETTKEARVSGKRVQEIVNCTSSVL